MIAMWCHPQIIVICFSTLLTSGSCIIYIQILYKLLICILYCIVHVLYCTCTVLYMYCIVHVAQAHVHLCAIVNHNHLLIDLAPWNDVTFLTTCTYTMHMYTMHIIIIIFKYTQCSSNPWKSNHRSGPVGHKNIYYTSDMGQSTLESART